MSNNKPGKISSKLILWILRSFLEHRSDIEIEINETKDLEPPYLIVSNHVNNWDPLLINAYVTHPISYVTSDRFFRNFFLRKLLEYTGAIPKTKFIADISTVKKIIKAKRNKRVIGIFPEGNRNWDGTTGEILFSTAKLIKLLKIPVIAVNLKGAHLSQPRWADSHRKGKIVISFKRLLSRNDITNLSEKDIYTHLVEGLNHNECKFQKNHMYKYKGKNIAQKLELFLFTCPACKKIDSMKSKNNEFYCQKCGYTTTYSKEGFFTSKTQPLYFSNTRGWNTWQLENIKNLFNTQENFNQTIMSNNEAQLYKAIDGKKLKKIHVGSLSLDSKALHFISNCYHNIIFFHNKIQGLNIQSNNKIEFHYNEVLHRISFRNPSISVYKWIKALEMSRSNLASYNLKEERKVTHE